MGFPRKRPSEMKIIPETHQEHPLTALRYPIVSGVHQCGHHIVAEARILAAVGRDEAFQTAPVVDPIVAATPANFGKTQHPLDISEIISKRLPSQASDVLDDNGLGTQGEHSSNRIGEQVPVILESPVLASDAPRLTGNARREQINVLADRRIIKGLYISLAKGPILHMIDTVPLIGANGFTGGVVPFHDRFMTEPGLRHTQRKAARTGKKLNRFQGLPSKNLTTRFATQSSLTNWHSQIVSTSQPAFRSARR